MAAPLPAALLIVAAQSSIRRAIAHRRAALDVLTFMSR
jgi:hypothetical protein